MKIITNPLTKIPELKKYEKHAVRLHPFQNGKAKWNLSKIGGDFIDSKSIEVPICPEHGQPLLNLIQIIGSDIKGWDKKEALQVFWCPQDHENTYCPYIHVRRIGIDSKDIRKFQVFDDSESLYIPKTSSIVFESIIECPSVHEIPNTILRKIKLVKEWGILGNQLFGDGYENYAEYYYQNALSTAPGWKLGGWCDWVQAKMSFTCDCKSKMAHLITLGSSMTDGATMFRWGKYRGKKGYDQTGIMIGDCGNIYVFECIKCKKIKWEFQCS